MRSTVCWLAVCGLVAFASERAIAADPGYPVLRGSNTYEIGPPSYRDWSGFYVGGHAGYANTIVNFTEGVGAQVANILRFTTIQNEFQPSNWASLPKQNVIKPTFGAFIGYNVQFEDTIVGVEANYNRTSVKTSAADTITRVVDTSDGYSNTVTVAGRGTVHLTDYGTLRARAGWIYNGFVPYGFAGVAIGRADVQRSASVMITGIDADPGCVGPPNVCLPPYAFAASLSDTKNNAYAWGWTLGAGVDWLVFGNVFLRGEFEYVSFPNLKNVDIAVSTVRVGAGVKF
jgi:opacity protein-like surface antigen